MHPVVNGDCSIWVSSHRESRDAETERERERETVGKWSASLPLEQTGEWIALQHLHSTIYAV